MVKVSSNRLDYEDEGGGVVPECHPSIGLGAVVHWHGALTRDIRGLGLESADLLHCYGRVVYRHRMINEVNVLVNQVCDRSLRRTHLWGDIWAR